MHILTDKGRARGGGATRRWASWDCPSAVELPLPIAVLGKTLGPQMFSIFLPALLGLTSAPGHAFPADAVALNNYGSEMLRDQQRPCVEDGPMGLFKYIEHGAKVLTTNTSRQGYLWEVGACLTPSDSAYRKCYFREKTGGPLNLDQCMSYARFFNVHIVEASEHYGEEKLYPQHPRSTEQFCTFYLPWDQTCDGAEGWLKTRAHHDMGKDMLQVGYYLSTCHRCDELQQSTWGSGAVRGRVDYERDVNGTAATVDHKAMNRTNWVCGWREEAPPAQP